MKAETRWLIFGFLVLASYLVHVAATTDWASSAGYVLVPALVGVLIIRSAKSLGGVLIASTILAFMVGKDAYEAIDRVHAGLFEGCLSTRENLPGVTDESLSAYCSCMADRLDWPVVRHVGVSFLMFREPEPIQSNTTLLPIASAASAECMGGATQP